MPIKLTRVTDIGLPSTTGNRLKVTLSPYTEQPYNRGELSHDFDDGGDLLTLVDINDSRTLFKDVSYSNIINGNTGLYFESGLAVKYYLNNFEGTPDTQYVTLEYFNQVVAALQAQIAQGGGGTTPVKPPLDTPTFGTPTKTASSVTLPWNTVPNATEYVLTRNGVETYRGALLTDTDTGLLASTGYTYILTANAPGYLSSSATIGVTTLAEDGTPAPTFPTSWDDSFIWDDNLIWNE